MNRTYQFQQSNDTKRALMIANGPKLWRLIDNVTKIEWWLWQSYIASKSYYVFILSICYPIRSFLSGWASPLQNSALRFISLQIPTHKMIWKIIKHNICAQSYTWPYVRKPTSFFQLVAEVITTNIMVCKQTPAIIPDQMPCKPKKSEVPKKNQILHGKF